MDDTPLKKLFSILPPALVREITAKAAGRNSLSELRLRRRGCSTLVFGGSSVRLSYSARESIDSIFLAVCRGTPYAFRDSVAMGFVPLFSGIRVGVAGRARYESGRLIGVSDPCSLVFRLPTGACDFSDELFAIWKNKRGGMLIFSPPGCGKTTALRSLAHSISEGTYPRRVVVVDEREEIMTDDEWWGEIDVLLGYRRAYGISLATRTLSPEVIITDEIAPEDAEELLRCVNCGVPIIATAHAESLRQIASRDAMRELILRGAFDSFVKLSRDGGKFYCTEVHPEDELLF